VTLKKAVTAEKYIKQKRGRDRNLTPFNPIFYEKPII